MSSIEGLRVFGNAPEKAAVYSFLIGDIHPYDMGTIIDKMGVAVRTGHHCAEPVMNYYNIPGTIRASFAIYNTKEDVDRLMEAVERAKQMFS
jgi:cysteine desulfurase/selenocysteine lyase